MSEGRQGDEETANIPAETVEASPDGVDVDDDPNNNPNSGETVQDHSNADDRSSSNDTNGEEAVVAVASNDVPAEDDVGSNNGNVSDHNEHTPEVVDEETGPATPDTNDYNEADEQSPAAAANANNETDGDGDDNPIDDADDDAPPPVTTASTGNANDDQQPVASPGMPMQRKLALLLLVIISICGAVLIPLFILSSEENEAAELQRGGDDTLVEDGDLSRSPSAYPTISSRPSTSAPLEVFLNITSDQLNDSSSPQAQALEFLLNENFDNSLLSQEKLRERYALAVIYYATGGLQWVYDMGFMNASDVCTWNRVYQDTSGAVRRFGVVCGDLEEDGDYTSSRLQTLELASANMTGTIPTELAYLAPTIEGLFLGYNRELTGTLPNVLSELTNLVRLELYYTSFTGTIPEWLGGEPILSLGLSNNMLTGTIPQAILNNDQLQVLGLDDNIGIQANLSTDFNNMTGLRYLWLEDNAITGSLTNELVANWPEMLHLDMSGNSIAGSLPDFLFFRMPNLQILDLHRNELTGSIPSSFGTFAQLELLALQENLLRGTIPSTIRVLTNLRHLDLSRNRLTGTIPFESGIHELSQLYYLYLGSNNYNSQTLPPGLDSSLPRLRELSLKESNLVGTIPTTFGGSSSLLMLDLHLNNLQGSIPEELGDMPLNILLLNKNALTGSIPSSFGNFPTMRLLLLDHNRLSGNTNVICNSQTVAASLLFFISDCDSGDMEIAEITCPCCTSCCNAQNQTCNEEDWHGNLSPVWENRYQRTFYEFDPSDDHGGA